jgi:hypothetical protein
MITRWFGHVRPKLGVTRYAWIICACMALDVLFSRRDWRARTTDSREAFSRNRP